MLGAGAATAGDGVQLGTPQYLGGTDGLGRVQHKATAEVKDRHHRSRKEGLGVVAVQHEGEKALWRSYQPVRTPAGRVRRRQNPALFSGAQHQDRRQRAQTEMQKVPSQHWDRLFHCQGDEALAQVARTGCEVCYVGASDL